MHRSGFRAGLALLALVLVSLPSSIFGAVSISVLGNWSETVDEADLQGEPGSVLEDVYESPTDQVSISIADSLDNADAWRVDVRRLDTVWDGGVTVSVKRTSDGSGGGTISGGSNYVDVTGVDKVFFSGTGDRDSVDVQLRLSGISVDVSPDSYSSTVTYTVVDL